MANIPAVVSKRLSTSIPKFRKILIQAKERDVNESDTVTIVTDMLEEIFGFDKYSEITREYAIQGTFCDLAIKSGKRVDYLIEVKAIGLDLKDNHIKQAVNYASREGIKWVVLTNGLKWEIHRVSLDERVVNEKVFTIDFEEINPRKDEHQELLFMLCKRGVKKDLIDDFYEYKQSVNKYTIGALVLSEPVVAVIRKELRKLKAGIKVEGDDIQRLLEQDVVKREVLQSEAGQEAMKQVSKMLKQQKRAKTRAKAEQQTRLANETIDIYEERNEEEFV